MATTSSKHYKDNKAYEQYKQTHIDVLDTERNFLKTLIHFQTIGLQIFERNQSQLKKLESQIKDQKEVERSLEVSMGNEKALQQQVQDLEW